MLHNVISKLFSSKIYIVYIFLGLLLIWHIIIMPNIDFGTDEAHYALYALHLDIGYFDHPPMVGWLLSPLSIFPNDITSRTIALLYTIIILFLIYVYAYTIYKKHTIGIISILIFLLSPITQVMSFSVMPDTALTIGILSLAIIFFPTKKKRKLCFRTAVLLGILLGFCGLSKYTAIFIPIAMFANKNILYWVKQPFWYLAAIIALLIITPYLYFLYITDFASFTYHTNRFNNDSFSFIPFIAMLGALLLSFGPCSIVFGSIACIYNKKNIGWIGIYILLLLLFIFISAQENIILPHWAISIFALLSPYIAHYIYTNIKNKKIIRRLFYVTFFTQTIVFFTTIITITIVAYMPPKTYANTPVLSQINKELKGWKELAHWGSEILEQYNADVLLTRNWTHVSRLAWYMRPKAVLPYYEKNQQFAWWFGNIQTHDSAIFITINNQNLPQSAPCEYILSYTNAYHKANAYYCKLKEK